MRLAPILGRVAALAACMLAGCQHAAVPSVALADPLPVNGIGYLVFNAPITPGSREQFITDIDKYRVAGAKEIHIAMNSPGGDIDSAQIIVDYMARAHRQDGIDFKAYNIGLVASAATFVFLNAQERYSVPRGTFLFHAAGLVSSGLVNSDVLRDQANKLDAYDRVVRATLKARTRLTDGEAQTYLRRTVVLNSDDARRDGIVDAIASFDVPKDSRGWIIQTRPPTTTTPARQTAPAATPGN